MNRCARRSCRKELPKTGMPFKIKLVGGENRWKWAFRHFIQFFVAFGVLRKHDPENYIPLCDDCGREIIYLFSKWLRMPEDEVRTLLGYK